MELTRKRGSLRSCLSVDLRRAFGGFRFSLAVVVFMLIQFLCNHFMINLNTQDATVYGELYQLCFSDFQSLVPSICAWVYALSVAQDIDSRYVRLILPKTTRRNYLISKGIVGMLTAFAVVAFGLLGGITLLSIWLPLTFPAGPISFSSLDFLNGSSLLLGRRYAVFLLLYIGVRGACAAVWVVCAMAVAVWSDDRFVALISPLIFSYLLLALQATLGKVTLFGITVETLATKYDIRMMAVGGAYLSTPREVITDWAAQYLPLLLLFGAFYIRGGVRRLKQYA